MWSTLVSPSLQRNGKSWWDENANLSAPQIEATSASNYKVYTANSYSGVQGGFSYDYGSSYSREYSETNDLLRTLIQEVRAGKVITLNGRKVGKQMREEDNAFYKSTGRGMFEH